MCLCFGFCAFFRSWRVNLGREATFPSERLGGVVAGSRCCAGWLVPVLQMSSCVHLWAWTLAPAPQPRIAWAQGSLRLNMRPHTRGRAKRGRGRKERTKMEKLRG